MAKQQNLLRQYFILHPARKFKTETKQLKIASGILWNWLTRFNRSNCPQWNINSKDFWKSLKDKTSWKEDSQRSRISVIACKGQSTVKEPERRGDQGNCLEETKSSWAAWKMLGQTLPSGMHTFSPVEMSVGCSLWFSFATCVSRYPHWHELCWYSWLLRPLSNPSPISL